MKRASASSPPCSPLARVAGRFTPDYVYGRTDRDGARFGDELERIGYKGDRRNRPGPAAAYLELHIEQGPVLEDAGLAVGVVEGIVGITWSEVTVEGRADHAGPSPMPLRRDALVAAARLIAGVDEMARSIDGAVGTVGRIAAEPNVINTIPGKVTLSVDLRHPDAATLDRLVAGLSGWRATWPRRAARASASTASGRANPPPSRARSSTPCRRRRMSWGSRRGGSGPVRDTTPNTCRRSRQAP